MNISTPISAGELLDKISIIKVKLSYITDKSKLSLISTEEGLLEKVSDQLLPSYKNKNKRLSELLEVNNKLWIILGEQRRKEKLKEFDADFIDLSRAVYFTNDQRFEIKSKINTETGAIIQEQKSYEKYL